VIGLFAGIGVTRVDKNGTVHFTEGGRNWKIVRDASGKVRLEEDIHTKDFEARAREYLARQLGVSVEAVLAAGNRNMTPFGLVGSETRVGWFVYGGKEYFVKGSRAVTPYARYRFETLEYSDPLVGAFKAAHTLEKMRGLKAGSLRYLGSELLPEQTDNGDTRYAVNFMLPDGGRETVTAVYKGFVRAWKIEPPRTYTPLETFARNALREQLGVVLSDIDVVGSSDEGVVLESEDARYRVHVDQTGLSGDAALKEERAPESFAVSSIMEVPVRAVRDSEIEAVYRRSDGGIGKLCFASPIRDREEIGWARETFGSRTEYKSAFRERDVLVSAYFDEEGDMTGQVKSALEGSYKDAESIWADARGNILRAGMPREVERFKAGLEETFGNEYSVAVEPSVFDIYPPQYLVEVKRRANQLEKGQLESLRFNINGVRPGGNRQRVRVFHDTLRPVFHGIADQPDGTLLTQALAGLFSARKKTRDWTPEMLELNAAVEVQRVLEDAIYVRIDGEEYRVYRDESGAVRSEKVRKWWLF
jgi:hypothetical protein